MKTPVLVTACVLACVLAVGAAFAKPSPGEVVAQRDRELNALIVAHDAQAARAYYDDGFLLTTSSGKARSKSDLLGEIARPGLVLDTNETSGVAVRVRGAAAVRTGILHQRGAIDGKAFDVRLHVTDTWVRHHGAWVILAGHASVAH